MSEHAPDVTDLLPSLEGARAQHLVARVPAYWGLLWPDLVQKRPVAEQRLAALLLDAHVMRRVVRPLRALMSQRALETAARAMPEVPAQDDVETLTTVVREVGPLGQCPNCAMEPGLETCSICGGTGTVEVSSTLHSGPNALRCMGCAGRGSVPCSTCRGTGRAATVDALSVADHGVGLSHLYAPELSLAALDHFRAVVRAQPPPKVLEVGLEARLDGAAYRSAPVPFSFHGHDYAAGMKLVRGALAGLGGEGEVLRSRRALHAWPYLQLSYPGGRKLVLLRDATGRHHAIV